MNHSKLLMQNYLIMKNRDTRFVPSLIMNEIITDTSKARESKF